MNRFIVSSMVVWLGVILGGCSMFVEEIEITSFEECVELGNPIMESYPRKCSVNNVTFVENISIEKPNSCTREYLPVCGIDNVTYSNDCMAGDVEIAYQGICGGEKSIQDSYGNKIPSTCTSWYDGCNSCNISENGIVACTRKYCPEDFLEEAYCLDE